MVRRARLRRQVLAALILGSLCFTAWGCAHGGKSAAVVTAAAPPPLGPRFTLHWNDAGDTSRVLRVPGNQAFRTDLTLTGLADSLQGYTIQFRLEPTTNVHGTAWRFANSDSCLAAIWAATAEKDRKARAPWPRKLLITDARPQPDGSVVFIVAASFDIVGMHPESTYSVCHMDFTPPTPAADTGSCAGWDAPVRIYVENASLLFKEIEQPVLRMGKPIFFEPLAPGETASSASRR